MDIIVPRAAALDVHKKTITACVRTPDDDGGRREQVRTFQTFLDGLIELRDWLLAERVTQVAMEATASYWLPVWRVLEDGDVLGRLLLVNARHVKHVPGRKTDVKDATWLCQLLEVGLLAGSFVPPPEIRRLRTAIRYCKRLIQTRTSEIQRIEKALEDAVIKLGSVASKTLTKSRRTMLEALIAGQRDPAVLAEHAKGRMRPKDPRARPRARRPVRDPPCGPSAAAARPHRLVRDRHRRPRRPRRRVDRTVRGGHRPAADHPWGRPAHRRGDRR